MIVIIGLVLLVAAVVVGVAAIATNMGGADQLTEAFKVFGYEMTGSTGILFLFGAIVGAVAILGLGLLLGGMRRTSHRGRAARRGLAESRHERDVARHDRDAVIDERDTANTAPAAARGDEPSRERHLSASSPPRHRFHLPGHRTAHR